MDPTADLPAIGRIAKDVAGPSLVETVIVTCEVALAFRVLGGRAGVEVKLEFDVERHEQPIGSGPLRRVASHESLESLHVNPFVSRFPEAGRC